MDERPPSVVREAEDAVALRPLRFEDVAEVLRLMRRAVDQACGSHYDAAQRQAVYTSYASHLFVEAHGPFETIVAEVRGRPVGVAQLDPADGRLRALFVDGARQQRGIGRLLLTAIEAQAQRRGLRRLHGAMALNAVPFYLRAGLRPCAGPRFLLSAAVRLPVLPMEKLFPPR